MMTADVLCSAPGDCASSAHPLPPSQPRQRAPMKGEPLNPWNMPRVQKRHLHKQPKQPRDNYD